jgi:hypothetical protein
LQRIAQAIDVVDPYAIQHTFLEPFQYLAVRCFKDVFSRHAKANQRVHIEKAAISEFLVGGAPVSQSIVLLVEHIVEGVDVVIQLLHRPSDGGTDVALLVAKASQQLVNHLFVAVPRLRRTRIGGDWQAGKAVRNKV